MGRVSGRLSRAAVLALLCAALVVSSWLLLPSLTDDATTRTTTPAPGEAAGDGVPLPTTHRDERPDRRDRTEPEKSRRPSPSPSATTPLTGDALLEARAVDQVNLARAKAGCDTVRVDDRLREAARAHSSDMARHERLSHEGSDGSSPWLRAEVAGYAEAMSENVAMGFRTPQDVMAGWMKSPEHRKHILDCEAKAVGVGVARAADGTPYWTQMFGRA